MSGSVERPVLAVGGILIEGAGETAQVLMIRRGRPPNEGGWSLPGGRVERGEHLATALAREMLEETGLEVRVGELVLVAELIAADHHYVVLDHACERLGGELRAGDDARAAEMIPIDELTKHGATDLVVHAVRKALAARG